MIIVDTSVVSEPLRPRGDPRVTAWLRCRAPASLFVTAVSVSELLTGVEILPTGRRKEALGRVVLDAIGRLFTDRVLPFDHAAAIAYASIIGRSRAAGASIRIADGQVAAIALVHGFAVATRDATPSAAAGVAVIDPWTA